jgi:5-oxoprolinase (ATP-hydrolysing) subunit C
MPFTIIKTGLDTRLLTTGSRGRRALGVPVGGPADAWAADVANALVGNAPGAPVHECTQLGPTLRANSAGVAVVIGAPMSVSVNGVSVDSGTVFRFHVDDEIQLGGCAVGVRAYLAMGGDTSLVGRSAPGAYSLPLPPHTLRVLPGTQADWFSDDVFFESTWTVSNTSNRMGLRLSGPVLDKRTEEMTSEPVAPGAVQVTNDGQPIVLGVDGQTIGGYPKVAHVIRADLDCLGQLRPGAEVRFERVTLDKARTAALARHREQEKWLMRLGTTGLVSYHVAIS